MFQSLSLRCLYASRGCTAVVRHEALLSHHEECGFAPVQCSHDGCKDTVNRQDLVSHRHSCEFRSITCEDCHEAKRQREYGKHPCVLLKKIDQNTKGLAEVHRILREIQDEQLGQGVVNQRLARRELLGQPSATQSQQRNHREAASTSSNPFRSVRSISGPTETRPTADRKIVVAGGGDKSYEVFNWSTQQWTWCKNTLFFDHDDAFSFVYDNKVMICGGTSTDRVECLDIASNRFACTFPAQLPATYCGKGVLCGDKILNPFKSTVLASYNDGEKMFSYGVAYVNENVVVIVGGDYKYPNVCNLAPNFREDVQLYNPTTKFMKKLAPLPYKLADMAVLVYNDNLILLGGLKDYHACNDVLMYNITNQQCMRMPSMLEKRIKKSIYSLIFKASPDPYVGERHKEAYNQSKCAAVIMGDTIVAIGGNATDPRMNLKTAEYLVLGEETWKKLPPMHYERAGATACVLP